MYEFDFTTNEMDKQFKNEEKIIFNQTNKELKGLTEILQNSLFNNIIKDLEEFMYERYDNIQSKYFNEVLNFMLNKENVYRDKDKEATFEKWLKESCSYDSEEFRKLLFKENKKAILSGITDDMLFERLDKMTDNSYWKSWYFKDITTPYPQSTIVSTLLKDLINKDKENFNKYIEKYLDNKLKDKKSELDSIKNEIKELSDKYSDLLNGYMD